MDTEFCRIYPDLVELLTKGFRRHMQRTKELRHIMCKVGVVLKCTELKYGCCLLFQFPHSRERENRYCCRGAECCAQNRTVIVGCLPAEI